MDFDKDFIFILPQPFGAWRLALKRSCGHSLLPVRGSYASMIVVNVWHIKAVTVFVPLPAIITTDPEKKHKIMLCSSH